MSMNLAAFGLAIATAELEPGSCVVILDVTRRAALERLEQVVQAIPAEAVRSHRRAAGAELVKLTNGTLIRLASLHSLDGLRGLEVDLFALTDDARREAHAHGIRLEQHMLPCLATTAGKVAVL